MPLRRRIMPYLQRVRDEVRVPIVYVSHDREEVEELVDVVVYVEGGRVRGVDGGNGGDGSQKRSNEAHEGNEGSRRQID